MGGNEQEVWEHETPRLQAAFSGKSKPQEQTRKKKAGLNDVIRRRWHLCTERTSQRKEHGSLPSVEIIWLCSSLASARLHFHMQGFLLLEQLFITNKYIARLARQQWLKSTTKARSQNQSHPHQGRCADGGALPPEAAGRLLTSSLWR